MLFYSMTRAELTQLYEKELAHLIEKGLELPFIRPILTDEDKHVEGIDYEHPKPHTHELWTHRPFLFDIRKLPATFHGFKLYVFANWGTKPPEFQGPVRTKQDIKKGIYRFYPLDVLYDPEKVKAYAEDHFLDICAALDDYTFTIKDICDMIVGNDFEKHEKWCEEERLKRILRGSGYDEDPDEDPDENADEDPDEDLDENADEDPDEDSDEDEDSWKN
jgi:hypothetical protein